MFMFCLIVAGEAVFAMPFHIARFFRPTMLDVFGFTNTELGAVQAAYGVVAMLAYFPGGPLADRYPARKLLAASLWSTAAGSLYLATIPGHTGAVILWGYWGVSTILLFWAALIRATREWGGHQEQGRAYGFLDGGRGVFAAVMASAAVILFRFSFPEEATAATDQERLEALRAVIYTYGGVTFAAGALVWFFVPEQPQDANHPPRNAWPAISDVVRRPAIWLQAFIVICAYVGYKGFDNYSLFAVEAYGLDPVAAAEVVALGAWVRPVAAVGAGFLGDRVRSSRVVMGAFVILLGCDLVFALTQPVPSAAWILTVNVLFAGAAVFGLRGVYFALFEEARVPAAVTGTAVGVVSVIGYTPDVFVSLVGGILLDSTPGVTGHQHFFLFLAAFAALGLIAASAFERLYRDAGHVSASPS